MPDKPQQPAAAPPSPALEGGTYEIIRNRLMTHGQDLRERLAKLNEARKQVFGSISTTLLATERVTTENNCVPRDMVAIGKNRFLFGYNVFIGLKSETKISDVFAAYEHYDHSFREIPINLISDENFEEDFKSLYKYYKHTVFAKFSLIGPHLFMAFRVGPSATDIKTFKWLIKDGSLAYQGNRSDHEFVFPPQHEFQWTRTHRDLHRKGPHPHISIEDRLFVETVGGDLTIKIEDNTETGQGIYSEPVEHKDQTLDDAEIFYASLGSLILLKVRPYQEKHVRYFIYNEKLKEVRRIDAIEDSCVLLPDDHGIIFSSGYYLQLGEFKQFPTNASSMMFERKVSAPNGEDFLYVFYNRQTGIYVLMSYNLIEQKVDPPIICNGFSLFENGEMALFKGQEEPQRHHAIQIWRTPYVSGALPTSEQKDSLLYKLGNPVVVRCMAECHEVLALLNKDDTYADPYVDLVKASGDILDAYFWLDKPEAFGLKEPLAAIKTAAAGAVDEFDKVVRIKRSTAEQTERITSSANDLLESVKHGQFKEIDQFVMALASLRGLRGEIISLRELRYVDLPRVEKLEKEVSEQTDQLSNRCVEFLLNPEALDPYAKKIREHEAAIASLAKVTDAKQLEEAIAATASELEMLIEIVSNLKIEDSTLTTRIIDGISAIYAPLNQIKAALRRKRQELQSVEGAAQFNSQMRLLDQSVANYLDICDSPERCEEYLTRMMIQVEELEGRFSDFDEFLLQLAAKREELLTAFEDRKIKLVEARNKRATTLMSAAERILKGIKHRVEGLVTINDINGYLASDLMVERVRDIVSQLLDLKDTVKAGDIQSRLKTIGEDAVRQLKDRKELFVDGQNILQFGRHKFTVNTLNLELTTVHRDGEMFFHLAGTNFFERVADAEFLATKPVWDQEVVSENREVYRAEYLACKFLQALESGSLGKSVKEAAGLKDADRLALVRQFMAPRYAEGYVKGIHDHDAAAILRPLLQMRVSLGLLRFTPRGRACASAFWHQHREKDPLLVARLDGFRIRNELFSARETAAHYISELRDLIGEFARGSGLFPETLAADAAEYLFNELTSRAVGSLPAGSHAPSGHFAISQPAAELHAGFEAHLRHKNFLKKFEAAIKAVKHDCRSAFQLLRDWLGGYLATLDGETGEEYLDETAAILLRTGGTGPLDRTSIIGAAVTGEVAGMTGSHPVLKDQVYALHYHDFTRKLGHHERETVPLFEQCVKLKAALSSRKREELRLEEFRPRVLTSFVRNRLIDSVYLPLIGANLAKQIGVAGEQTRTDRMGMLLLISPPGYGKTTLMEYIANRLGIIFMKINGPAIGHQVTSLDPAEARNASAREELEKLNLSLEMGDNVMLYLDDIQHCNPELLQKFISLCDAQRKIEGVYKGRARTYDLRGKKVAVVMAGNPYTESGEKFKIPDMLANRADTYNLGDILAGHAEAFKTSYLENALTSNPVLGKLSSRAQKDVYAIIKIAETGSREGVNFEGNYAVEEINEMVDVMNKLIRIREVVLRVNQEYIHSAGQAEEFRTEPPFRLQGSYRNMNRLAERVLPVMNDDEITALIQDHYKNEAQTLTTGAEANLLKFKELMGWLTEAEANRWDEIKRTFKKNQLFRGIDQKDPVGQVVAQLSTFSDGLDSIKTVLADGLKQQEARPKETGEPLNKALEHLAGFSKGIESLSAIIADHLKKQPESPATFRLIDPAAQSDYQITNVSRETLEKIWNLVAEDRKRRDEKAQASYEFPKSSSE